MDDIRLTASDLAEYVSFFKSLWWAADKFSELYPKWLDHPFSNILTYHNLEIQVLRLQKFSSNYVCRSPKHLFKLMKVRIELIDAIKWMSIELESDFVVRRK